MSQWMLSCSAFDSKFLRDQWRGSLPGTALLTLIFISAFSLSGQLFAQQQADQAAGEIFHKAIIRMHQDGNSPAEIRFPAAGPRTVKSFLEGYRQVYGLPEANQFKTFQSFTDRLGQTHFRVKQYYQGIELAEVQYLLHQKNGVIHLGHGKFIHGLSLEVQPTLSEAQALESALNPLEAESYMWENSKNEALLKREQQDPAATFYPRGKLMISAGRKAKIAANFRLVYRFDIYTERPLQRYYVDVDANSGEVLNKISRIQSGDVQGEGQTLYNGLVPIVVTDADYPLPPPPVAHWHLDSHNAFGGSGESWWMSDPSFGNEGGYDNGWYEVLDTAPINLSGSNLALTFYHRYAVESPGGAPPPFDGWDGIDVRISTDNGNTWEVLANPSPAYSNSSLYSFGQQHGEGPNIPGWTDQLLQWSPVTVSLSAYSGRTVRLRFAFASDPGFSTADSPDAADLFGWQVDEIKVSGSAGTLFFNNGTPTGMTARNIVKEVTVIEGNYRLREADRGGGIFTYDALKGSIYAASVDFVDDNSSFTDENAQAGVSAHWGAEIVYDYYLAKHGRSSYDNAGGRLISYVHVDLTGLGQPNNINAFWDGTRMTYGDGGSGYGPVVALDVIGHELTHGVTQYTASLIYQDESGALNESFSDIFGEAVEAFESGGNNDWLLAADIGPPFRSMSNPKSLINPDTYLGFFWAPLGPDAPDDGGVHTNSGVQNHWFYLLSEGGSGVNDNGDAFAVTGIGIEKAAQIAYRNLTVYLMPASTYFDARFGSMNAAGDLFGAGSPEYQAVIDAWNAVGVYFPGDSPLISLTPAALNFLAETGVESDTAGLRIHNEGLEPLTINGISLSGGDYRLETPLTLPLTLENYRDSLDLRVIFTPSVPGNIVDSLTISSNDPLHPLQKVDLQGKGYAIRPALSGVIYAVTGASANGVFITIDQNNGKGEALGPSGFDEIRRAAVRPSNGEIIGTFDLGSAGTGLLRIDALTGEAYEKSVIPVTNIHAIAFDSGDILYAGNFVDGNLYRYDFDTPGSAFFIGGTGIQFLSGLAINPLDGQLWGISASGTLYTIDKTTAAATAVGASGFSTTPGIAFDAGGTLFGLSGLGDVEGQLIRLNTATGKGSLIGPTGFKSVNGLAIRGAVVVGIEDDVIAGALPGEYGLQQNYPNPFNPATTIGYALPEESEVTLKIFDLLGREIKTLLSLRQPAGFKTVSWDGRDQAGEKAASGIYLYRLEAQSLKNGGRKFVQTRKLILLK